MENTKKSMYTKLNTLIDAETEKGIELMDCALINECVDGILRLKKEESYQITAQQREENIQSILKNIPKQKNKKTVFKVLLVAAIIIALLVGTVFAYTIVEYKIHDYGSYSEVWVKVNSKKLDKPVEVGYVPEGFELIEKESDTHTSYEVYFSDNVYITISKYFSKSQEINTEYGEARTISANNVDYIFFGEEIHGKGVFWVKNNYYYLLTANLSDEELLKIAQSVS